MDSERKIHIGYAGSLASFFPSSGKTSLRSFLRKSQEGFKYDNLNSDTRSGYYLFRGIQRFKQKYPQQSVKLSVELWGSIHDGNRQQVLELGIGDLVSIEGYFSKSDSVDKLKNCDILFLPLETAKNGQKPLMIPGKLFELLSIGKPIFALVEDSDCRDILIESGLGIICSPFQEDEIANRLFEIFNDIEAIKEKHQPNKTYIEKFNFKNLTKELSSIFDKVQEQQSKSI